MAAKKFPVDFKTCTIASIKQWCLANDKMEWLKEVAKDKPGFFTVRKKFFETFAPDAIPAAKPKKIAWWDEL
jgi:hypothetical protein